MSPTSFCPSLMPAPSVPYMRIWAIAYSCLLLLQDRLLLMHAYNHSWHSATRTSQAVAQSQSTACYDQEHVSAASKGSPVNKLSPVLAHRLQLAICYQNILSCHSAMACIVDCCCNLRHGRAACEGNPVKKQSPVRAVNHMWRSA